MKYLLLVEDSSLLQERVLESVAEFSHALVTECATKQDQGIALLDQQRFDLLIADIELEEGNGFEVIRHAQNTLPKDQWPVFIVLSNHVNFHYRKLAANLGIQYFFDKSMQYDEAMEIVGKLVESAA